MPEIPNDISELFDSDRCGFHNIADFDPFREQIVTLLDRLHTASDEFATAIKDIVWKTCPADELIGRDFITMMIGAEPDVVFQVAVAADKELHAWLVTTTHGTPPDSE